MSKIDSEISEKTLFIDIGNSSKKLAYQKDKKWVRVEGNYQNAKAIQSWMDYSEVEFSRLVVSSVRKDKLQDLKKGFPDLEIIELSVNQIPAERMDYKTPQTLGLDRYLGCLGGWSETQGPVLVIDVGTACTLDFMDDKGIYRGGIIAPGLRSMLKIFKQIAPELPEVKPTLPENWPGKSTEESLQLGQVQFFLDGVEAAIQRFKNNFGECTVLVTGGSGGFVSVFLQDKPKVDNLLIFKGMKAMLSDL